METKTIIRVKVAYAIGMALLASICLVSIIILWYKADKSSRYALFIPVILGYAAAIYMYRNRKPIVNQ